MMYYLIYKKKDDTFYSWTDSKELLKIFMKINKDKYCYIKTKSLLKPGMENYELQINDYQLDAYFQGQTNMNEDPLLLRMDEFGLLETSMYNSLYYLSTVLYELSSSIKYFKNNKDDKQMMRTVCSILSDTINETINDDEIVYSDIIDIIKFYKKIGINDIDTLNKNSHGY